MGFLITTIIFSILFNEKSLLKTKHTNLLILYDNIGLSFISKISNLFENHENA